MAADFVGPFTADDFTALSELVIDAWSAAADRDWSVSAGTLEWSCWTTADHTIDCVFSYALFLASRAQRAYPKFGELHALDDAQPADLVEGLRAVTGLLGAAIVTAEPGTRSVIRMSPQPAVGSPADFAARGAHEMILHAHDVCSGLGSALEPPADVIARLLEHTRDWWSGPEVAASGDPWSDLLQRSGRSRMP